jgi:hypothetical protein
MLNQRITLMAGFFEAMRKGVNRWALIKDMLWEEDVHRNYTTL